MKNIVILGAGKIGRGFVAEVFAGGGYKPIFVDSDEALVKALKAQGRYTLYKISTPTQQEKIIFSEYEVLSAADPSLSRVIADAGLMAVAVYPGAFGDVAQIVKNALETKFEANDRAPLDIVLLANVVDAQKRLLEQINAALSEPLRAFARDVMSVCGTIVIRVAVSPTPAMLEEDPLTVLTDGYGLLPVENKFIGERPDCPMLEYHDALEALETRKMYTYNMAHAATAYLGAAKGYETIAESIGDPEIEQIVRGALEEITLAYTREGTLDEAEAKPLVDGVIKKYRNTLLKDPVARVGGNPIRKLGYSDRLVGAALLARKNGICPYYLLKATAYGFLFAQAGDEAAAEIRLHVMTNGIDSAIRAYTGLWEPDVIYAIKRHYLKADGKFVAEDAARVAFLKRAYELGFESEKQYRGCAQGTLLALKELTGIWNKDLFRAATGFSGGMALCGDGVCGGYSGGVMFMGLINGRDYDRMLVDGDKPNQYVAYEAAQRLRDHFEACFASPICMRIHETMFRGEHYILRTKARRDEFEAAGAHTVVCTTVVALACTWVAEIILDMGLYSI